MQHSHVALSNLVANQLPEFIRTEYPTFVAFLEAYYEYADTQGVSLKNIRDIDDTLDEFIQYFKAELAHNYPVSKSYDTERYLLKHVKDQYLAKGSEASYKLLFRLLFGKDVYMDYPGKQMLRVSDGKWQQDVSIFVRVDTGNAYEMIGKTVSIQTTKKISRDAVTAKAVQVDTVTATIENVIRVDGETNIYEFFLDRNFYGEIYPKDVIKYSTYFQGQVLPCTAEIDVGRGGEKFRPGMVFKVSSGEGTPLWFKVLNTDETGALLTVDLIKFGLYYNTDFAVTLLPTSAVTTRKKLSRTPVIISYEVVDGVINKISMLNGGSGYQQAPDVIIGGSGTGAIATAEIANGVISRVVITNQGQDYAYDPTVYVGSAGSNPWVESSVVSAGNFIKASNGSGGYLYYIVTVGGTTGSTAPSHTVGTEANGTAQFKAVNINDSGGSGATLEAIIGTADNAGKIVAIKIVDGGSGYSVLNPPSILIVSNQHDEGYGAEAEAVVNNGVVRKITIDPNHKGSGYTTAFINVVPKEGDVGTGAESEPILGSDYWYNYDDTTNGFTENGYLNAADYWDVTEHGRGAGATIPNIRDNVITKITIVDGGSGYDENTLIDVDDPTGTGLVAYTTGTGTLTTTADSSVVVGTGTAFLTDIEPGQSIFASDQTTFIGIVDTVTDNLTLELKTLPLNQLDGEAYKVRTGPVPVIENGTIVGVKFIKYGYGYTNPTVSVSSAASPTVVADLEVLSADIKDGCVIELNPTLVTPPVGASYTMYGTGYDLVVPVIDIQEPFRSISGVPTVLDSKATAKAKVVNGAIVKYFVTDPGSGYTVTPKALVRGSYGYADGAYVGTIRRQYFIDAKDTISENPALVNVKLGAVARYPGYFKTNDGFLDDSIFIQDSYYYQTFSYVIRIDEQLQSYASLVRTMLHPSGMALFGEYSINNAIALSIGLDSLVKSLGVTLYDSFKMDDSTVVKSSTKYISDEADDQRPDQTMVFPSAEIWYKVFVKALEDTSSTIDYSLAHATAETSIASVTVTNGGSGYPNLPAYPTVTFSNPTAVDGIRATGYAVVSAGKVTSIVVTHPGYGYTGSPTVTVSGGTGGSFVVNKANLFKFKFTKSHLDNVPVSDTSSWLFTQSSSETQPITDTSNLLVTKVFQGATENVIATDPLVPTLIIGLNNITDNITDTGYNESGYLHLTPYDQGGYFANDYNVGRLRDFSS